VGDFEPPNQSLIANPEHQKCISRYPSKAGIFGTFAGTPDFAEF
jgi:hypothetical protein